MAYAAPQAGQHLQRQPDIEGDHPGIAELARRLTTGRDRAEDQVEALFRHVDQEIGNEPTLPGQAATAAECLAKGKGDSTAKARLLTALCRNRGIPARIVTGLPLTRGNKQVAHFWVETWANEQWLPMCRSRTISAGCREPISSSVSANSRSSAAATFAT